MMEISTQGTILEGTLGLPLLSKEEMCENSDNRNILQQVAVLEETSVHMMQLPSPPQEDYDHNAGPPTDQLPEPIPGPSHHVVLGSSGSEVRSTDAILTSQFGLPVKEIKNQNTILASGRDPTIMTKEEMSENSDNKKMLKQVAVLEETSGHMIQLPSPPRSEPDNNVPTK